MLENIYYVGQSIAVLAILASLIALILQIRQSNRLARAEMSVASWLPAIREFHVITNSEEGSAFYHKALYSDEKLTPQERLRLGHLFAFTTNSLDLMFILSKEGLCNATLLDRHVEGVEGELTSPRYRKWWRNVQRDYYKPDFQKFFDQIVDRAERRADSERAS